MHKNILVGMQTNWSISYGSAFASTLEVLLSPHHTLLLKLEVFPLQPTTGQCVTIHFFSCERSQYTNNKSQSVLKTSAEVDASIDFLPLK